ncbi:glucuronate isomerase [Saccharibacillus sp. CPCC 101409]|uniref:glucuronate isomerase n=1 Tax=Saccharibacillus sp. CPCC 101409 TaxID=3058041 RepID=UPI002671BCB3|nr:glucuronate isomerase [Saccharibacillus sp. CPCC 101409]MDO3410948.1 glucuronate isomerase [Saccharibacillus sp. CPCC 101409]
MSSFIQNDFLLRTDTAKKLYREYAEPMPIIDYHCHLDPKAIADNQSFGSMTEVWLGGDHYKWRALRTLGVEELYITGDAPDEEKFARWAEALPQTLGNPLFHWSALELKRYFGIDELLTADNWSGIYRRCNERLAEPDFTAQGLIIRSNVKWICTTDDPADDLSHHKRIAEQTSFDAKVTPTFRPDKALQIGAAGFVDYLDTLGQAVGYTIDSYAKMEQALIERIEHFHRSGCLISDHAFTEVPHTRATAVELDTIFAKKLGGEELSKKESDRYTTELFLSLGRAYAQKGWAMQLHIGAIRNPNTRMLKRLGPDTGFDTIGDPRVADSLCGLLDALDSDNLLPRTILYNLNATSNDVLAALISSFQQEGIRGKMQFGSGWWYNDQKEGMLKQLTSLSSIGLLSSFVGMLTDSRSFLSYTRHEYFRRILCNLIGGWAEDGEVPDDLPLLGKLVQDVSFNNANAYFGMKL